MTFRYPPFGLMACGDLVLPDLTRGQSARDRESLAALPRDLSIGHRPLDHGPTHPSWQMAPRARVQPVPGVGHAVRCRNDHARVQQDP